MRGNGQRLESGGGEPLTNIAAQIKFREGHRRAYHFRSWPRVLGCERRLLLV